MTIKPSITKNGARRILVVDDHPLVRTGLASLIGNEPDLQLCGETGSLREAQALALSSGAELVIVDLTLADGNGLDLVRRLRAHDANMRFLVCSIHDEMLYAHRAINAGASGYLNKTEATRHIIEAIRRVLGGGIWLSEAMTQRLLRAAAGGPAEQPADDVDCLTNRELEVFKLIGEGVGPSDIAGRLCLSVKTVETHREKIKKKLGAQSGGELTRRAIQWALEQG